MSGFACQPSIVPPPTPPASAAIVNDGWFPEIQPDALRKAMRIRDQVTAEQLADAIIRAVLWVNPQLEAWKAERATLHLSLGAVPAPQLAGESRLVLLYRAAIAAAAKANLVERQRDTDLTGAGQRKVEELEPTVCELRRDAIHAVRDMLGNTRTCVELI